MGGAEVYVARFAAQAFWSWVRWYNPDDPAIDTGGDLQCYLTIWLEEDKGVEHVGKNYLTFMQTVVAALQQYADDPSVFDLHIDGRRYPRKLTGVYDEEDDYYRCFYPDYYELMASRPPGERSIDHPVGRISTPM